MDIASDFVQLARLGMSARPQDVQTYVRRIIRKFKHSDPDLSEKLANLLALNINRSSPLRDVSTELVPVDVDSRLHLVKHEYPVQLDVTPILPDSLSELLEQIIQERHNEKRLAEHGLLPTRSVLMVGPPGLGKTLTSRWLAARLNWALVTLDLSTVMSSLLGKTGANLRSVLDYAKQSTCLLLLDEFDAIAKRRDEMGEIGELKRLVTVLLQEIDDWPATGLLVAATNHPELLDPAVWRRFDSVITFPAPDEEAVNKAICSNFGTELKNKPDIQALLATLWKQSSFSDIARASTTIRRRAVMSQTPIDQIIISEFNTTLSSLKKDERLHLAVELVRAKRISQRNAADLFAISRDTIRKHLTQSNCIAGENRG